MFGDDPCFVWGFPCCFVWGWPCFVLGFPFFLGFPCCFVSGFPRCFVWGWPCFVLGFPFFFWKPPVVLFQISPVVLFGLTPGHTVLSLAAGRAACRQWRWRQCAGITAARVSSRCGSHHTAPTGHAASRPHRAGTHVGLVAQRTHHPQSLPYGGHFSGTSPSCALQHSARACVFAPPSTPASINETCSAAPPSPTRKRAVLTVPARAPVAFVLSPLRQVWRTHIKDESKRGVDSSRGQVRPLVFRLVSVWCSVWCPECVCVSCVCIIYCFHYLLFISLFACIHLFLLQADSMWIPKRGYFGYTSLRCDSTSWSLSFKQSMATPPRGTQLTRTLIQAFGDSWHTTHSLSHSSLRHSHSH